MNQLFFVISKTKRKPTALNKTRYNFKFEKTTYEIPVCHSVIFLLVKQPSFAPPVIVSVHKHITLSLTK